MSNLLENVSTKFEGLTNNLGDRLNQELDNLKEKPFVTVIKWGIILYLINWLIKSKK
jgi:hypothetical protein